MARTWRAGSRLRATGKRAEQRPGPASSRSPGQVVIDGERLPFDALVIGTGVEPKRSAVPGLQRSDVHVLRTVRNADSPIPAASRTAAVIGAGFIGLEVAAAAISR